MSDTMTENAHVEGEEFLAVTPKAHHVNRTHLDAPKTLFFVTDAEGELVIPSNDGEILPPTREHAREIKYQGERIARYEFTGYVR